MVKIYIPQDKGQGKTQVRGLWRSNSQGLCYDYLTVLSYDRLNYSDLQRTLRIAKQNYKQECIFYTIKDRAYIYYNKNKTEVLTKKEVFYCTKSKLKDFAKACLDNWQGVTITQGKAGWYILVSWHN